VSTLRCISPIDESVFATRDTLPFEAAQAKVLAARAAQRAWAARPLAERISLVRAGVARLGAMGGEVVTELAHMTGRPVRYGGEFGGVDERASYMADIADAALAPMVIENTDAFERRIAREPHGVVLVVSP
jgi:acyl-CoA reductase-like NAD-dependent aldehyde dehydrogenase